MTDQDDFGRYVGSLLVYNTCEFDETPRPGHTKTLMIFDIKRIISDMHLGESLKVTYLDVDGQIRSSTFTDSILNKLL